MYSRCLWSVWFMVFLSVVPAVAQTQASISGVIHDPSGAVIPGVTVMVTNPATNFLRTALSNEAGVFGISTHRFPAVPLSMACPNSLIQS